MNLAIYYVSYFGLRALLIFGVARILHRSGARFLNDAFNGDRQLISSVSRLLDTGFYLVSIGVTFASFDLFDHLFDWQQMVRVELMSLGWFMFLLGGIHMVNLLLLALFRRRNAASAAPVAG